MRVARMVAAIAIAGLAMVVNGSGIATAHTCTPTVRSSCSYSRNSFTTAFAIRLCDDRPQVGFGVTGVRTRATGNCVFITGDGFAPCSHRVCVAQGLGFSHGWELARYQMEISWGPGIGEHLGPVDCIISATRARCREASGP